MTSTTVKILPVIKVNDIKINMMKIGEITKALTYNINKKILKLIIKRLIKLNKIKSGYIYIQITRGTAKRNHVYSQEIPPNLVIFCLPLRKIEEFKRGVKVRTSEDLRWGRCDVK